MKSLFLALFIGLSAQAQTIKQLHCPGPGRDMVVADPAIVADQGSVLVMGTGDILRWTSVEDMLLGRVPTKVPLTLFKEVTIDGKKTISPMAASELPWDLQFYVLAGRSYLYGGVMSPLPGSEVARWPEDNISRRIKVAEYNYSLKGWVFKEAPVFGSINHRSWIGHSYGQQIVYQDNQYFMLHEEISREGITEIFLRPLYSPYKAGPGIKVVGVEHLPLGKSYRVMGGHLLEGPRHGRLVLEGKTIDFIFFSTGDFPTKNYASRVAYSFTGIKGPYKVVSNELGPIDLTQPAHKFGLYGVGRPFPFTYKGQSWIIFHGAKDLPGVDHTKWPATLDFFQRCLFAAPIGFKLVNGELEVSLQ